jgi:hypothetical protein
MKGEFFIYNLSPLALIKSVSLQRKIPITMEELSLTTPALLFSAVSLILLAYTNRFLSYAQLVRTLKEQHLQHPSKVTRAQIDNLRRRLHLTRTMQLLGVTSLFLCVVTMFLIYVGLMLLSAYVFGAALLLLVGSLGVSIWEIQISVRALEIHLKDMENPLDKRDSE